MEVLFGVNVGRGPTHKFHEAVQLILKRETYGVMILAFHFRKPVAPTIEMQADGEAGELPCQPNGLGETGALDHEAGARDDARSMAVRNSAIHPSGDSEVIGVDDEKLGHPRGLSPQSQI